MLQLFGGKYRYNATDEASGQKGYFLFKIVKKPSGYRAYVLKMPPLKGRESSLSRIHMLRDGSQYYVCVQGNVSTAEKMKAISRLWAKRYMRYVETGMDYNVK